MSDHQLPEPTEIDDLASAALDNEATPAERARVDAEPELAARVEEFRALSDQVAALDGLTDATRDALIATALSSASTGEVPTTPHEDTAPARPVPIARHQTRRQSQQRSPFATYAAIAAVVIAILAIPALLIGLNRTSDVHSTALSSGDAEASYESNASGAASDAANDTTSTTDPSEVMGNARAYSGQPVALGAVASASDLQSSVQDELDKRDPDLQDSNDNAATTTTAFAPSSTTAPTPPVAPEPFTAACEDAIRQQLPDAGALVLGGTVDYQGSPRHVYVFQTETNGPVTIVVAEPDTCEIVTHTVLPHS